MKRLAGETAIYGVSSIVGKFLNESECLDSLVDGDIDVWDGDRLFPVYEQEGDQAPDAGICDDVVQSGIHFRPVYGVCVQCADAGQ